MSWKARRGGICGQISKQHVLTGEISFEGKCHLESSAQEATYCRGHYLQRVGLNAGPGGIRK